MEDTCFPRWLKKGTSGQLILNLKMEVIIQDKKKNGGFREVAQMEGIPQIGGHLTHMVRCYFFLNWIMSKC